MSPFLEGGCGSLAPSSCKTEYGQLIFFLNLSDLAICELQQIHARHDDFKKSLLDTREHIIKQRSMILEYAQQTMQDLLKPRRWKIHDVKVITEQNDVALVETV